MRKIKLKRPHYLLTFLTIVLFLLIGIYYYLYTVSLAKDEFVEQSVKIAEKNESAIFRLNKIVVFSSADAINQSENQSLQNLNICQYSDIAITIDNTSYIKELTNENTIKDLFIDDIEISTTNGKGNYHLNYKNPNDFAKFKDFNSPDDGKISFQIVTTNEENEEADYNQPTFYTDCSNPISLGYINRDIVENYSISENATSVAFSGKLLGQAGVNLQDINYTIRLKIHIKNNLDEKFVYQVSLNSNLTSGDNSIFQNGYLYQGKTLPLDTSADFFREY